MSPFFQKVEKGLQAGLVLHALRILCNNIKILPQQMVSAKTMAILTARLLYILCSGEKKEKERKQTSACAKTEHIGVFFVYLTCLSQNCNICPFHIEPFKCFFSFMFWAEVTVVRLQYPEILTSHIASCDLVNRSRIQLEGTSLHTLNTLAINTPTQSTRGLLVVYFII